MAMTVTNVMASIPVTKQTVGMTKDEIIATFMMAGYGLTKAEKRTNELLMSAQLQTDGSTDNNNKLLYWSIFWPYSGMVCDMSRVGAVRYEDPRHTRLVRLDGQPIYWYLADKVAEE